MTDSSEMTDFEQPFREFWTSTVFPRISPDYERLLNTTPTRIAEKQAEKQQKEAEKKDKKEKRQNKKKKKNKKRRRRRRGGICGSMHQEDRRTHRRGQEEGRAQDYLFEFGVDRAHRQYVS